MKSEAELLARAAHYKFIAAAHRTSAAMSELAASTTQATIGMMELANALAPLEEWPDVVLVDILDAEVIGD